MTRAAIVLSLLSSIAFACGGPSANGPGAENGGAPCGLTPQEMAAPTVSNATWTPPAPSASASAPPTP